MAAQPAESEKHRSVRCQFRPPSKKGLPLTTGLFSPRQILRAYSKGEIGSQLAMNKLGLDHYRQLAIAMADAELALPGTDSDEIMRQADVATRLLQPYLKGVPEGLPPSVAARLQDLADEHTPEHLDDSAEGSEHDSSWAAEFRNG